MSRSDKETKKIGEDMRRIEGRVLRSVTFNRMKATTTLVFNCGTRIEFGACDKDGVSDNLRLKYEMGVVTGFKGVI